MFFATSVRRARPDTASRSDHTSVHFLREIFIACCHFFAHCAFLDEFTVPSSIARVSGPVQFASSWRAFIYASISSSPTYDYSILFFFVPGSPFWDYYCCVSESKFGHDDSSCMILVVYRRFSLYLTELKISLVISRFDIVAPVPTHPFIPLLSPPHLPLDFLYLRRVDV